MKFKTKICYRCSTSIESKEEGQRLKIDFDYGSFEWFCNDCAKDYREEDYRIDDEEVFEYEDLDIPLIPNKDYMDIFIERASMISEENLFDNDYFIKQINKVMNTKLDNGYYPSSILIYNAISFYESNEKIYFKEGTELELKVNVILKGVKNYIPKVVKEVEDYEKEKYFLNEPYIRYIEPSKSKDMTNISNESIDKPTKANTKSNEPKNKPRRFPTTIEVEEINDEGEFIMNSIDLLKKGKLNYIVYGYLQEKSDGDKENFDKFRKVYIKDINHSQIAKECSKVSRNTVPKALSKLEELGLLSSDTFKDDNGEYKKLYNLDGKYVILDFNKRPIQRLTTCIKSEGVSLFLILKHYCRQYGKCTLTQEQLFEKLGYANCDKNRDTLNLFLETLEGIGCIKVERIKNEKKQNKNIYYCLA